MFEKSFQNFLNEDVLASKMHFRLQIWTCTDQTTAHMPRKPEAYLQKNIQTYWKNISLVFKRLHFHFRFGQWMHIWWRNISSSLKEISLLSDKLGIQDPFTTHVVIVDDCRNGIHTITTRNDAYCPRGRALLEFLYKLQGSTIHKHILNFPPFLTFWIFVKWSDLSRFGASLACISIEFLW